VTEAVLITTGWPVVVLVCPTRLDASWIADLDRKFAPVFARRERFAVITDTAPLASMPSAIERKLLTEWASRPDQAALQKRYNVGSATIVQNPIVRGTLQALYWFWTPGSPQNASRDFDDAWAWCIGQLEAAKVPLALPAAELKSRVERERVGRRSA
jgi:hypothetical protein